jgi:hypothetical protein
MSHDAGRVCVCRTPHAPAPLELEQHHIWPLGMDGPAVPENVVWVCPTTHTNTHEILREIVRRGGNLTWGDATDHWVEPVSRYAFELAHEGYRRYLAGSGGAP